MSAAPLPPGFWVDAGVILLYFAAIIGIGLRAGRGNTTLKEFALGGRSIPWWAVLASIVAAETSAATFLGTRPRDTRPGPFSTASSRSGP